MSITGYGLILLITLCHIPNLHSNFHCRSYTFSLKTKNVIKKVKTNFLKKPKLLQSDLRVVLILFLKSLLLWCKLIKT